MYCQDFLRYPGLALIPARLASTAGMGSAFCGHCQRVDKCPVLTIDQAASFLDSPTDDYRSSEAQFSDTSLQKRDRSQGIE